MIPKKSRITVYTNVSVIRAVVTDRFLAIILRTGLRVMATDFDVGVTMVTIVLDNRIHGGTRVAVRRLDTGRPELFCIAFGSQTEVDVSTSAE